MLIGIDASRASYPQRTGTENYSLFLIRALLKLDQDNQYHLYFSQPPAADLIPLTANARTRTIPFPRLWTHIRLSWEMASRPPDVLFVPAHVLPLLHPRHSVVTVHDLGYLHYPQAHTRWSRWYLQWSTAYNSRAATHLIADSEATKRDLIKHLQTPSNKISVVYPGYDPSFSPERNQGRLEAVRKRYHIPGPYVIHVGTLHPRKNLRTLLDAFAVVAQQDRGIHLVMAGKKGWLYEPLFAQMQQLGLEKWVHFIGYIPQEDLPVLISGARLFVLPSLYEGFGMPVLEAMACGTPVICSDVSSLPEVAGDAAILVNPHDTEELVRALQRLLYDDVLHHNLVQEGLKQIKRFSWGKCAREVQGILQAAGTKH